MRRGKRRECSDTLKERKIYVKTVERNEERNDTAPPYLTKSRWNPEPICNCFSNEAGPLFKYGINSC
jgi:hypothetical protein